MSLSLPKKVCVCLCEEVWRFGIKRTHSSPLLLLSSLVFVAISLFDLLQFPLTVFPNVISSLVEASVSCSRLYKFLILEELDRDAVNFEPITPTGFASKISRLEILNGTFSWNKKVVSENGIVVGGITTLRNIILSVHDGCLLAVVGG